MKFSYLKGKIITKVSVEYDTIIFTTKEGRQFVLYHKGVCCEDVYVEDICGNITDILNSPLLVAAEVSSKNSNPSGIDLPQIDNTYTWTFYKLDTIKGGITIRWFGTSNGYYSEKVSFSSKEEYDKT